MMKLRFSIKDYDAIACAVVNRDVEDPSQVLIPLVKLVNRHISQEQIDYTGRFGPDTFKFQYFKRDLPGRPAFNISFVNLIPRIKNYLKFIKRIKMCTMCSTVIPDSPQIKNH
jgi:hypothetical protein